MDRLANTVSHSLLTGAPALPAWRQRFTPEKANEITQSLGKEGSAFLNTDKRKNELLNSICRGSLDTGTIRERFYAFRALHIFHTSRADSHTLPPIMRAALNNDRETLVQLIAADPGALTQPYFRPNSGSLPYQISTAVDQYQQENYPQQLAESTSRLAPFHPFAGMNALTLAVASDPSGTAITNICNALPQGNKSALNTVDGQGNTPLSFAVDLGHLDCVNALIKGGADVNAMNARGRTPLMLAARQCNPVLVGALLNHGAPALAHGGQTNPLSLAVLNQNKGNVKSSHAVFKLLIKATPSALTNQFVRDNQGNCAFSSASFASLLKNLSAVGESAKTNKDPELGLLTKNCLQECWEIVAQSAGFKECCSLLAIDLHTKDPEINNIATSALFEMLDRMPAELDDLLSQDKLSNSAKSHLANSVGELWIANTPNKQVMRKLKGCKAKLLKSCLHLAPAFFGNIHAAITFHDNMSLRDEAVIKRANLNTVIKDVVFPWLTERFDSIDTMIAEGANPHEIARKVAQTLRVVKICLPNAIYPQRDRNHRSAVERSLEFGINAYILKSLNALPADIQIKLAKDANVPKGFRPVARSFSAPTPLLIALERKDWTTALSLVQKREELNTPNNRGRTPLMLAVRDGNEELVNALLQNSANTCFVAEDGATALSQATLAKSPEKRVKLQNTLLGQMGLDLRQIGPTSTLGGRIELARGLQHACSLSNPDQPPVPQLVSPTAANGMYLEIWNRSTNNSQSMTPNKAWLAEAKKLGNSACDPRLTVNLLRFAAQEGNVNKVDSLLTDGALFESGTVDGDSPLVATISNWEAHDPDAHADILDTFFRAMQLELEVTLGEAIATLEDEDATASAQRKAADSLEDALMGAVDTFKGAVSAAQMSGDQAALNILAVQIPAIITAVDDVLANHAHAMLYLQPSTSAWVAAAEKRVRRYDSVESGSAKVRQFFENVVPEFWSRINRDFQL